MAAGGIRKLKPNQNFGQSYGDMIDRKMVVSVSERKKWWYGGVKRELVAVVNCGLAGLDTSEILYEVSRILETPQAFMGIPGILKVSSGFLGISKLRHRENS